MGTRHVEELFSAAYDDALGDAERRRFDDHLAACPQCTAAAADYRRAIDAVRALPAARMPVRVVLPSTPPVAERTGRLRGLLRVPQLGPAWGAAAMAAVGVAVVVVAVRGHVGSGGAATTAGSSTVLHELALPGSAAQPGGGGGAKSADTAITGSCPLPVLVTKASASVTSGGGPAGFANRVSVRNPQRPGQELVLATTGSHYAAGSQVLVFAALTSSGSAGRAVVPCVTLEPQQTVALIPDQQGTAANGSYGAADRPVASGSGTPAATGAASPTGATAYGAMAPAQAPALSPQLSTVLTPEQIESFAPYMLERPLAIAAPTGQTVGGTLPVQVVTIPAGLARGTVLRLVALIPAGSPGQSDRPAVEAVITLDVS